MALFGFGKKKDIKETKETEVKVAQSTKDTTVQTAKKPVNKPSVRVSKPKSASTRIKRPGPVKRPSVAVRPKKPDSFRTIAAKTAEEASSASQRKVRTSTKNKQIGQLLLKANKITQEILDKALAHQSQKGGLLGQILVGMEYCTKADVAGALKRQRTITTVNLETVKFDPDALSLLSQEFCEKNKLIPFELVGSQLFMAMSNALDTLAKNEVKETTQMHIKIFDAANDDIQSAITKYYSGSAEPAAASASITEQAQKEEGQDIDDLVIEIPEEADAAHDAGDEILLVEEDEPEEIIELSAEAIIAERRKAAQAEAPSTIEDILPITDGDDVIELAEDDEPVAIIEEPLHEPHMDACHAGEMPSVGELPDIKNLPQREAKLKAIPIPQNLAEKIVDNSKVDPVKLWIENKTSNEPIPATQATTK